MTQNNNDDIGASTSADTFFTSSGSSPGNSQSVSLRLVPPGDSLFPATPIRRRGKSMNRRTGQNGSVFVKSNCKLGRCQHRKNLCPKYGRYWKDVVGQHERERVVIPFGPVTKTVAERKLREHIQKIEVNSVETFNETTSPSTTFKSQATWWLREIRAGRIVSRKRRIQIKPATISGYETAVNFLNERVGNLQLADLKNEAAKQLVLKMRAAKLSEKTMANYFQVLRAVVASVVSDEGEQLYPRNWNLQFIGLPVVDETKQAKPSLTVAELEQVLTRAKSRYKVLFTLLAGTGLRIGEALALEIGRHISGDCSTIHVRQSVWGGLVQAPKTANAVRDIDLPSGLAAFLKAFIGNRTSGFVFQTKTGKPLTQRNVHKNGLSKIRRDLNLKQYGKALHAFRRFRVSHLRKNRVPWDLEKLWIGHANKSVSDKYAEQLKEDVEWRKEVAEQTGLGFSLPILPVGQLGQPSELNVEAAKAA
jgi:integrase